MGELQLPLPLEDLLRLRARGVVPLWLDSGAVGAVDRVPGAPGQFLLCHSLLGAPHWSGPGSHFDFQALLSHVHPEGRAGPTDIRGSQGAVGGFFPIRSVAAPAEALGVREALRGMG